jgi:cytochrome P450
MLNEHANEHELEIGDWNTRATLDIIGVAGLGRDFNTLKDPEGEIVQDYNALTEITPEKAFFFVLNIIFPVWLVSRIPFWRIPREAEKIARSLYTFAFNLARERRADLAQLEAKPSQHTQNDILTLLIKSNDFTDDELAHQMLTMMAAGHETTANTLSWCIYLLAQHPEIQNRLREEIRSALPSPSQYSSTSESTTVIDDLPLLNAVCNETFRLYPVVPITSRQAVRETTLGPYKIPIGTNIYIVPWAINRSTRFWGEDAMVFTPNRWIDADPVTGKEKIKSSGGATGAFSLLTFLHGPRSCIGQG